MPHIPILKEIMQFLYCSPQSSLELCFAVMEIHTYHQEKLLKKQLEANGRIIIEKHPDNALVKMKVIDSPVFSFSFWFKSPVDSLGHQTQMLQLPRPLALGTLKMDSEQLILAFTIDAPDPSLKVRVKQVYRGLQTLKESGS